MNCKIVSVISTKFTFSHNSLVHDLALCILLHISQSQDQMKTPFYEIIYKKKSENQFFKEFNISLPVVVASWGISDSKAQTCFGFFNITEGDPLDELSEDESNDQVETWLTDESLWVELLESRDSLQLKLLSALDLVEFLLFRTNELLIPGIF